MLNFINKTKFEKKSTIDFFLPKIATIMIFVAISSRLVVVAILVHRRLIE
jgi:hypothetical protein